MSHSDSSSLSDNMEFRNPSKRKRTLRKRKNDAVPSRSNFNVKLDSNEEDFEGSGEIDETWQATPSDYESDYDNSFSFVIDQKISIAANSVGSSTISGSTPEPITLCTVNTFENAVEEKTVIGNIIINDDSEMNNNRPNNTATDSVTDDVVLVQSSTSDEQINQPKKYTIKELEMLYKNGDLLMKKRTNYKQRRSGAAITSDVWEKIHILSLRTTDKIINDWVQCSQCLQFLKYNGRTTTGLKRHNCSNKNKNSSTMDSFLTSSSTFRFTESDKQIIRDGAEKFIVRDLRPYFALEGEGLRSFLRAAIQIGKRYPTITEEGIDKLIPSRRTMKRQVEGKTEIIVNQIKTDFKKAIETVGGFSCTADLYSDKYKHKHYLGMTAKLNIFDNDSIIQKEYVIHLNEVKCSSKTADNIEKEIDEIFADFDITKDQIRERITFTTDRGGNIRNALCAGERFNCFAHMLNNIVDTMCSVPNVKQMISDAASLVRYMKKSGLSNDKRLKRALQSFIETRWNTVYYCLQSILDNYNVILEILLEKENVSRQIHLTQKLTCLPKSEMENVANLVQIFTEISISIQGEQYETLHMVWPYINRIHRHLMTKTSDSDYIVRMKAAGRDYLLKSKNIDDFKPQLGHKIAVFLHPAMKSLNCASEQDKIEIIEHIKLLILSRDNEPVSEADNAAERIEPVEIDDFFGEFLGNNSISRTSSSTSSVVSYLVEIDNYMHFTVPMVNDLKSFKLTQWWYEHRKAFPNLFRIFLRNSANTASSASSERAFSIVGILLDPRRSSFLPTSINELMLTRNLHHHTHRIIK